MVDNHGVNGAKRIEGEVKKKLSPSTYSVEVAPDVIWKRHADQMLKKGNPPLRRSLRIAQQNM